MSRTQHRRVPPRPIPHPPARRGLSAGPDWRFHIRGVVAIVLAVAVVLALWLLAGGIRHRRAIEGGHPRVGAAAVRPGRAIH